ncbi:PHA/PHB synthase family protein [Parachitinimonas caeni]|uniref:Alpha/beta fold hydrolase n=1 Tax=Parachitinimonas caeni TaxID=3031301 RepID=A0ABT7DR68_9NEIS|nr:alpha/beta fold hydrolase [Parachitinimonas caeni]MDK2122571.1 alpha/beta fold hydrolase [Parachitinimonas caeni]
MPTSHWLEQQEVRLSALRRELRQRYDPFGLIGIWQRAQAAWLAHPKELALAVTRLQYDLLTLNSHGLARLLGQPDTDVFPQNPEDQRFSEPVWSESPYWDYLKESYLMSTRWIQDMLYESPGLTDKERRMAAFWLRQWLNAVAPTNFLLTNPTALAKARESQGASLLQGLQNFAADMQTGDVRMTDRSPFKVGENLATTPGAVVFQNHLLEVIHYSPTTPQVHAMPLVLVSPWINKYYILDLTPAKSLVRYLVAQGFNVFITSWKNPTPEMADITFDDYIVDGIDKIVEVARSVGKSEKVGALGYCIGGTLLSIYMAWCNRRDPDKVPVAHWTLMTTLVDFGKPGDIEVFIDEDGLDFIDRKMEDKGFLSGQEMASSFRMLRPNSLIWNYWVKSYLLGETPPAMDVLYWNTDLTRMPRAMHRYYLREFYLNNRVVEADSLVLAGHPIDLGQISQPLFIVAAEEDHITPWRETYKITQLIKGPAQFTLSTSGHILGMINPPVDPPKRSYWQADAKPTPLPEDWFGKTTKTPGSWWPSWIEWLRPRCGEMISPLPAANRAYPKLSDAPGTYVFEI